MASSLLISHSNFLSFSQSPTLFPFHLKTTAIKQRQRQHYSPPSRHLNIVSSSAASASLEALIFDCDGVILESEHLHRQAYNDAFAHFNVICSSSLPLNWSPDFYDVLQNRIGGGKPKMRWYFKEHGWPSSNLFEKPPEDDESRAKLIDTLQVLINA